MEIPDIFRLISIEKSLLLYPHAYFRLWEEHNVTVQQIPITSFRSLHRRYV